MLVGNRRTADYSLMREMNIALILECLHWASPLSRARLAQITGLHKTTVSSLVKELLRAGFVREGGVEGDLGRPAIQLQLNPDAGCILGAEVGVDFISVIATRFDVQVVMRHRESTLGLQGQAAVLERLIQLLHEAEGCARQQHSRILGLGLGAPGLVDVATGSLLFAPNLGWSNVPLRHLLEAEFSFPVHVHNEADLSALGESYFGAARGIDHVLYVSAGVGIGGGIVINHVVLQGGAGLAGEVGHMTMDPEGPPCNCGNRGCWEVYASQAALFRRVQHLVAAGQASGLVAATRGGLEKVTVPGIVEAAQQGDRVALAALRETGRYLGIGIANLINALNPQRVVFGGILSLAHAFLLPEIRACVEARALRWAREATSIVIATHGQDACVMGGVAMVYHNVLARPREVRPRLAAPTALAHSESLPGAP